MPRKKKPETPAVALPGTPEKPQLSPLVYEERLHLLRLLNDPIFVRAWRNAELSKPSFFATSKEESHYPVACAVRLHEIKGWELFKAAILRQTEDPKPTPERLTERYPDSGTLEAEVAKRLPAKPPPSNVPTPPKS